MKYTKELLSMLAAESKSVLEVVKKAGGNLCSGGTHAHVSRLLRDHGIDTNHFVSHPGQANPSAKKKWHEVLIINTKTKSRTVAIQLRRSLIEYGRSYKCEVCGIGPEWNGQELRLQVDHKDGNYLDNRPENLRFICPNCHTQTKNYCNNKGLTGLLKFNKNGRYPNG